MENPNTELNTEVYGIFVNGMDLREDYKYIVDIYNFCKESLQLTDEFSEKIYVFKNTAALENISNEYKYADEDKMDVYDEKNNSIFISFLSNEIVDETTKNNLLMCLYNAFIENKYICGIISYTVTTELLETEITRYRLSQIIHMVTQGREEERLKEEQEQRLKEEQEQRLKEEQEYEKETDEYNINLEVKKRKDAFYDLEIDRGRYEWFDSNGNIIKDIPTAKLKEIKKQAKKYYFEYTKPNNKILEQEIRDENKKKNEQLAAIAREAANKPYDWRNSTWRYFQNKHAVITHGFNLKGSPNKGGKKKSKKSKKSKKVNKSKKSKKAKKSNKSKKSKK